MIFTDVLQHLLGAFAVMRTTFFFIVAAIHPALVIGNPRSDDGPRSLAAAQASEMDSGGAKHGRTRDGNHPAGAIGNG